MQFNGREGLPLGLRVIAELILPSQAGACQA